jgi:hypothetical protein
LATAFAQSSSLADNLYVALFNTLAALERLLTSIPRTDRQKPTTQQPLALAPKKHQKLSSSTGC